MITLAHMFIQWLRITQKGQTEKSYVTHRIHQILLLRIIICSAQCNRHFVESASVLRKTFEISQITGFLQKTKSSSFCGIHFLPKRRADIIASNRKYFKQMFLNKTFKKSLCILLKQAGVILLHLIYFYKTLLTHKVS